METLLIALGALTALAAASRSTWSPCGLSMLSSITPFGERARGHRYRTTAAWFVTGAAVGGATLGAVTASLAAVAETAGLASHRDVTLALAAVAAAAALLVDTGVAGDWLPIWRRQVNDHWLGSYRSWVYGAGFGWQIGVGVATYVMTAAVFLTVALAVLTADPLIAFLLCTGFGLARGLAVLLTRGSATPADLHRLHRRLEALGPVVRRGVLAVEIVVAGLALGWRWPAAGIALAVAGAGCEVAASWRRGLAAPAGALDLSEG